MNSWISLAHITDKFEDNDFKQDLDKMKKNLDNTTDVYIIRIYAKKIAKIIHVTNKKITLLKTIHKKIDSTNAWCLKMVDFVKTQAKNIIALNYYGHGGAVVIGPWKKPFMSLVNFVKIWVQILKPKILCFDSCYMGSLSSLYEISFHCKFVLASPSWHPYSSLTTLDSFGQLPNFKNKNEIQDYISKLSCEFNHLPRLPKYACLVAFNLTNLQKLVKNLKVLKLNKSSRIIGAHDDQQYDLNLAVPKHLKQITKELIISPPSCTKNCPKRIHGISVREPDTDDIWHKYFIKMKWAKKLKHVEIIKDLIAAKKYTSH